MNERRERSTLSGWAALLLLAVVSAIAIGRTRAPGVRGADTPENEFSAVRALERLRSVLGDEAPHPIGSEAHARVRERIVAELEGLGLSATIEESFRAGRNGVVAVVRNIVAFVPGGGPSPISRPGVLLSCHYDSVAAGPGAGDDGSGVASLLEIARVFVSHVPPCPVTLLFTDGEEAGLLGAEAFSARHDLAAEFRAVVNLEARGTDGPCYLFETSRGNSELIRLYAGSADHPSASSVTYEIYKRLPNDTDLTVFKREGLTAANFAFVGGLRRYHTSRDDLAHLSPASVQHQGEQALALVRALALASEYPAPAGAVGDAVYTDVLGLTLVRWPQSWAMPLASGVLAVLALRARRDVRRRTSATFRGSAILRGAALAAVSIACGALVPAVIVHGIEMARGLDDPWAGHPLPAIAALVAGSVAAVAALARAPFFSRADSEGAWIGTWILLAGAGVAAAAIVPGATVLLLPPCSAAALSGFARAPFARAAVPLVVLAVLWVRLAVGLEATAELHAPAVLGATVGVVLAATTPALALVDARGLARLAAAAGGITLLSMITALLVPSHTPDRPAWLNLVHLQDADAGTARVFANTFGAPLLTELRARADFSAEPQNPLPGVPLGLTGYSTNSESAPASPPSIEVISEEAEEGARTIEVHVASTRGARSLVVVAKDLVLSDEERGLLSVRWNGHEIEQLPPTSGPKFSVAEPSRVGGTWIFLGIGSEGIDLRFRAPADGRAELRLVDLSSSLPAAAVELARARPPTCVPRGGGDVSLVLRRVEL